MLLVFVGLADLYVVSFDYVWTVNVVLGKKGSKKKGTIVYGSVYMKIPFSHSDSISQSEHMAFQFVFMKLLQLYWGVKQKQKLLQKMIVSKTLPSQPNFTVVPSGMCFTAMCMKPNQVQVVFIIKAYYLNL